MCTSKNLTTEIQERVIVTVVSQEPKVHIHNENFSDPEISVSFHEAQDAQRPLNDVLHKKAKPNEDQWFFFNWEDTHPSVHFLVVNITSETKQCATVRIRNSSCSIYKENIKEFDQGQYLTMTTRAAIVVPRDQYPEVFYLSVLAETDDTPCGLPGNLTGRSRIKPYEFNIHKHHESAGFLFLPVLVIPICSILFILGSLYIKCNDVLRTTSTTDRDRAGTLESLGGTLESLNTNAPAEIHTQNGRSDSCTEGLVTVGDYDIPHTRVDFIPVILTLIVLPVFLDILSTRVERYQKFGELDACTFNIECSFPFGPFPDIGRAVTCSSYTLMGITFLLLLFTHHRKHFIKNNPDLITGVRHDYDIFRAIAYCLISQGIIGFVYHVCPNENVESLSDMFVLIAIAYSCQKIHQNRHPDVRHKIFHPLYVTVFCIGLHGVLNMFVHRETVATWVVFGALHLLHIVVVPLQFVLLDSMEISFHPLLIYSRLPLFGMKFSKICGVQRVVGVAGIILNLVIMLCAVILQPSNFMVYLLSTFSVNMVLYLVYYVLMKSVHYREKITHTHVGLVTSVILVWLIALYYLVFHTSIAPGIAPALSRESAKPCVVWEMFDGHDAWHFFSAFALFLSNFLVMIVDDCQAGTQTSHLHVF